jgi:hypothetical protein
MQISIKYDGCENYTFIHILGKYLLSIYCVLDNQS